MEMRMSELSDGELLNLLFSNPFVTKDVQAAAMCEYRRRMKEEIIKEEIENGPMYCDEDAWEFIRSRSNLSEDVIKEVLELEMEYMRSVGLIVEREE